MSRAFRATAAVLALAMTLTGCVKATTFNPNAAPDTGELDRLQGIVNSAPDLESARTVLGQLDTTIRVAVAKHSPETKLAPYGADESLGSCREPNTWAVGQEFTSAPLSGRPAPTPAQWQMIVDEVLPALAEAGFEAGKEPSANVMHLNYGKDGAFISLTNAGPDGPLTYKSGTGCRLPTAWRTSSPPPGTYTSDPNMHYPYLFGEDGGRTVKPG